MLFKEIVDGRTHARTDDGRRTLKDHKSSLSTSCSGELKICLVQVTCPPKIGRVGTDFFLFYYFIFLLMLSEGLYNDVISMCSLCDYLKSPMCATLNFLCTVNNMRSVTQLQGGGVLCTFNPIGYNNCFFLYVLYIENITHYKRDHFRSMLFILYFLRKTKSQTIKQTIWSKVQKRNGW